MKSKITYLIIALFVLASCATKEIDSSNSLILPPDFAEMPNLESEIEKEGNKEETKNIINKEDINELKDLLLN